MLFTLGILLSMMPNTFAADTETYVPTAGETIYLHQKVSTTNITMMYGGYLTAKQAKGDALIESDEYTYLATDETKTFKDGWKTPKASDGDFGPYKNYEVLTLGATNNPYNERCGQEDHNQSFTPNDFTTLPCYGTFYTFEPKHDGTLKVYLLQNGNKKLYFVDEKAKPLESTTNENSKNATLTLDNGGYSLSEKAFANYTFNVEAGKTYYLFGIATKIGFCGFDFTPTDDATTTDEVNEYKGYTYSETKRNCTVSVRLNLASDAWNALTLPFSMTESQVKAAFGDDAEIMHYSHTNDGTAYFVKHYYQTIKGGQPVLLYYKGSQTSFSIEGVTVDSEAGTTIDPNGNYDFVGSYASSISVPVGAYFIAKSSSDGKYKFFRCKANSRTIPGFRAYLNPRTTSSAKLSAFNFAGIDNGNSTTGIAIIDANQPQASTAIGMVYNLGAQLVGTDGSLSNLPAGVYVVNGKKYVVK